jgi:hypothetical protein
MNRTVDALNLLSIFGPSQSGAYREHSARVREVLGEDVETRAQQYVRAWTEGGAAGTIILTGNAGTGKTALAETYCVCVGGDLPDADALTEVAYGRYVVKDLSGVDAEARLDVLELEAEVRGGHRAAQLLLCANEGVLRDGLERRPDAELEAAVDEALRVGSARIGPPERRTTVINMNRQRWTRSELWNRLLDYLVRDELWQECETCGAAEGCPIRANAQALRRPDPREAARRLVQLASGGSVATLRELLAVLSHAITGGMTCSQIESELRVREFTAESAYSNLIFGSDLTADRIERSPLLLALREAAVGRTADVEVDGWLRDPAAAPAEVRDLALPPEETPHAKLKTRVGVMTFGEFGETITISDDPARVSECLKDFSSGRDFLALWRRRIFFGAQSFVGGRTGAFRRLSGFSFFGELLELAEAIRRGLDHADHRQRIVRGMNFLSSGFHAFSGHLVVPDSASLVARNPGAFRPPSPSLVHSQIPADKLSLTLEDPGGLSELLDTDDVRVGFRAELDGFQARLLLTPRLYQAIREASEFRAPVGADIPEMNELTAFYGELASRAAHRTLTAVDPVKEVIRTITPPSFGR